MINITESKIKKYREYLIDEEKSENTVEKYIHDVNALYKWLDGRAASKQILLEYKQFLTENYQTASVNAAIASINSFFKFLGNESCKIKSLKQQRDIFCTKEKELTKPEYELLLKSALAMKNKRLYLIMQTICSCGIRISELKFITVEAVNKRRAEVRCKGKNRIVMLPEELCRMLLNFAKERKIKSGSIFISKNGNPLDRSNIWKEMKKLCEIANVSKDKVFPHNLRHLFARTYYRIQKDIVRLADILGHSSINTTRIYTIESGDVHRLQIQKLGLIYANI